MAELEYDIVLGGLHHDKLGTCIGRTNAWHEFRFLEHSGGAYYFYCIQCTKVIKRPL